MFSALFDSQSALASPACTDEDSCTASPDIETPPSPFATRHHPKPAWSPTSGALLGTFEESVLNGRLEPVSTVHGFTAELGASGSFCPKHLSLPVTVFFYTLGDNDKVSTPYLVCILANYFQRDRNVFSIKVQRFFHFSNLKKR